MAHDNLGNLLVSGGLPPYTEITQLGAGWSTKTATAFAAVVTMPLTVANLEVVNNSAQKSMVIDTIFSWQLLGTAVAWAHTVWAQVGAKVYSANTALVIGSANGLPTYTSAVGSEAATAITQTVVATEWRVFPGSSAQAGTAAATPFGANVGQVDGRLIVPPGKALHVAVSASVTTASAFQCGASWFLVDLG